MAGAEPATELEREDMEELMEDAAEAGREDVRASKASPGGVGPQVLEEDRQVGGWLRPQCCP